MKTVALEGLGCRLNISETGTIAKSFVDNGYKIIPFGESADVTLINTCTVTSKAEASCRNLIRKARKTSPLGKIVIVGCYAQISSDDIEKELDVDLILGSFEKGRLFEFLKRSYESESKKVIVETSKSDEFFESSTTVDDFHTRAFLKIQDGCDYVCSYCIIPYARGKSRSLPIREVVESAKQLVTDGFKEIILTGVNIDDYKGAGGESLVDLVRELIKINKIKRLRLSSLGPNIITDELLLMLKDSSIYMDHFHLSLQSGDDEILKGMRRRYSVADFKNAVTLIKKYFKDAAIGVDAIVGFPGENELSLNNTFNLLRELPITHFHIFPYSPRKGTASFKLKETISSKVKKDWTKKLISLGEKKMKAYSESFIGEKLDVLFEKNRDGEWEGLSSNFLKVKMNSSESLKNEMKEVLIRSYDNEALKGIPLP